MLLYLVKYLRPDIVNATQELSKIRDGVNPAALLEMNLVIKYALGTKNLGLKIEPTKNNKKEKKDIVCCSDSDYVGDPVTRRSVN